ncbi:MAG TPA: hypothetical protein PKI84_01455, partial [Methanofastidiosum sp.]|nr:hypothetical protein [Methanofastidiosum sp.]
DIVVWRDRRNGTNYNIWGYNLKTQTEFAITSDSTDKNAPAIYGYIIAWEDPRNGNTDIYGYNLDTKQEFAITTDTFQQENPSVYCGRVVYQDNRNGNWDIYLSNLDVVCEEHKKSLPIDKILKILEKNKNKK